MIVLSYDLRPANLLNTLAALQNALVSKLGRPKEEFGRCGAGGPRLNSSAPYLEEMWEDLSYDDPLCRRASRGISRRAIFIF